LRKFGGQCILGFQSIAQVRGINGDANAQTIVENCGNTVILRCSASEHGGTSRFASQLIRDREVLRIHTSKAHNPDKWLPTRTTNENRFVEAGVMPSEIEQLPDLVGYLKFASSKSWQMVGIRRM
jgi:type IV secretory pathway TraG/TraD family ATPase VirD4